MDMRPIDCGLHLDDRFGIKRWLMTWTQSSRFVEGKAYERERVQFISLDNNLRRLLETAGASALVRFAAHIGLRVGLTWSADQVRAEILAAVEQGRLVIVRESEQGELNPAAVALGEARRLLNRIMELSRGQLRCSGRPYSLHLWDRFDRSTLGLTRRLVLPREGATIIKTMIVEYAAIPELAKCLEEAGPLIANPAPGSPHPALVLLRHLAQTRTRPDTLAPAATPSQLWGAKTDWIEVEVFDDMDEPWTGKMRLTFADGARQDLVLDKDGFSHFEPVESGQVKLEILTDVPPADTGAPVVDPQTDPTPSTADDHTDPVAPLPPVLPTIPQEPSCIDIEFVTDKGEPWTSLVSVTFANGVSCRARPDSKGHLRLEGLTDDEVVLTLLPESAVG
jgi:hypothetical protein